MLEDSNILGQYTVLPSNCSKNATAAANATNNPVAVLQAAVAAAAAVQAGLLAAMRARLDAAKPVLDALMAEPPPSLNVTTLYASLAGPVVWLDTPQQICYRVHESSNTNPKVLRLMVGDGSSGSFYVNAMGAGDAPLPREHAGCAPFWLIRGLPLGRLVIGLQDQTGKILVRTSFSTAVASITFSNVVQQKLQLKLVATWTVDLGHASARDVVRVFNVNRKVVYWFFTSCRCQGRPGPNATSQGSQAFFLYRPNSVLGGYFVQFFPGGGNFSAAVGVNWIPWAQIGW